MKILFDITHPVDVNFFKNSILNLHKRGFEIYIIYRDRGRLAEILRFELGKFPIKKIGDHKKKGFLKKISTQLFRDYKIIPYIKAQNIDLVVCFGSTSAISTKICGIPYLSFDDDFEYKIPFYHANWFATRHIYPDFIKFKNSRTFKYRGFKELAYLHPNYLKTSEESLVEYSILPNEYVFIREIAKISLNYKDANSILKELIETVKKKGLSIVLSLEDKSKKQDYINDCIILEEPVEDIYSLLYHPLFAISSGDTVARETSLLGVPTIYTGGRDMIVNGPLIDEGLMYESTNLEDIQNYIENLSLEKKMETRKKIINLINNKWDDTTSIILNNINDFV